MSEILISETHQIGGGMIVTYKGTPDKCAYWSLVGFDGASETTSVGSLLDEITVNNGYGFSVNRYVASADPLDVGKIERIKVTEHA